MTLNQILLIGNAGRDAEMRYTPSGTAVTNFSIAVSRRYQVRDEWQEETEWFNVSAWDRQAEIVAERVKRGTRVFVDGRLSTREYTAGNGETRVSLDVNANRVIVLTPRETDGEGSYNGYADRRNDNRAPSNYPNGHGSNGQQRSESRVSTPAASEDRELDVTDDLENLPW